MIQRSQRYQNAQEPSMYDTDLRFRQNLPIRSGKVSNSSSTKKSPPVGTVGIMP